jgi:hypothetical protein
MLKREQDQPNNFNTKLKLLNKVLSDNIKIQDDNYLRSHIFRRSTVRAGSVMLEESYFRQSKVRKLAVAIAANQYIFQFQVPENQRNTYHK